MLHRIREVRRAKGYTLLDVAERCYPPTTAQTPTPTIPIGDPHAAFRRE